MFYDGETLIFKDNCAFQLKNVVRVVYFGASVFHHRETMFYRGKTMFYRGKTMFYRGKTLFYKNNSDIEGKTMFFW